MGLSHILPISISLRVTNKKPRIVSVAHLLVGATAPQGLQAELDQRITGIRGSYQFISIHIISPCEIIQTYNCIITNCIYVQHMYIYSSNKFQAQGGQACQDRWWPKHLCTISPRGKHLKTCDKKNGNCLKNESFPEPSQSIWQKTCGRTLGL